MDRLENARASRKHEERFTDKDNVRYGQRRFRLNIKSSKHMTEVAGYSEAGMCRTLLLF